MQIVGDAIQQITTANLKKQAIRIDKLTSDTEVAVKLLKAELDELKQAKDKVSHRFVIRLTLVIAMLFFFFGFISAVGIMAG